MSPIARATRALVLASLLAFPGAASARTLRVGPERNYRHLRDAALAAQDGDIILLDAGTYVADVVHFAQNDLVIWAPEGRASFVAQGAAQDGKGIWVVEGRNFTAENIEFSGCRVPDHNGAGVRIHAKGKVTLRNCVFHDNEMGVLGDADEILIDRCTFDHNGLTFGERIGHNIYIWGPQVTVQQCYIRRSVAGHNVKSRALNTYVIANRIADEADGQGSYAIDVPDCGRAYIIGNVIEQGPQSPNYTIVSYGAESDKNGNQELYVVNNTLVNDGPPEGIFLKMRGGTKARVVNNLFYGPGAHWVGGSVDDSHNAFFGSGDNIPAFADPGRYDYRLTAATPHSIVDRGIPPGRSANGVDLTPKLEYVYDAKGRSRPVAGPLDLGAFEYVPAKTFHAAPKKKRTYSAEAGTP